MLEPTTARIITRLMLELASELDLHHEDRDMVSLHGTMGALAEAADLLKQNQHDVPGAYLHILGRYIRFGAATSGS